MSLLGILFLFDSLKKKKECQICGAKVGTRDCVKLKDGFICKLCYSKKSELLKVSPTNISVDSFSEHLKEREKNKEKLPKYNFKKLISGDINLLIDEEKRAFIVNNRSYFNLSSKGSDNPNIFYLDNITDVIGRIEENYSEITYSDSNSWSKSFKPKVYSVSYTFKVIISLKNSLVPVISLELGNADDDGDSLSYDYRFDGGSIIQKYDEKIGIRACKDYFGRRDNKSAVLESESYLENEKRLEEVVNYLTSLMPGYDPQNATPVEYNTAQKKRLISSRTACKLAFWGFILSLSSIFCCCGVVSPVSLILSIIGLFSTRKHDIRAKVYSIIGIVLSLLQIGLAVWFFLKENITIS